MPLLALALMSAAAAQAPAQSSSEITALTACRAIAEPEARLACYDKAAGNLERAIATKQVTVLTRKDVRETKRSLFGFSVPKLPFFGGDDEPESKQIIAKIASVRSTGYGKFQFKLDDGAWWETTEGTRFGELPSAGQNVTIKRGTMGNYFILFPGIQPLRGRRVS